LRLPGADRVTTRRMLPRAGDSTPSGCGPHHRGPPRRPARSGGADGVTASPGGHLHGECAGGAVAGRAYRQRPVVATEAWPRVARTRWIGAPRSRAWVAWAWRSQRGETPARSPPVSRRSRPGAGPTGWWGPRPLGAGHRRLRVRSLGPERLEVAPGSGSMAPDPGPRPGNRRGPSPGAPADQLVPPVDSGRRRPYSDAERREAALVEQRRERHLVGQRVLEGAGELGGGALLQDQLQQLPLAQRGVQPRPELGDAPGVSVVPSECRARCSPRCVRVIGLAAAGG
jgi:hypothetical protein